MKKLMITAAIICAAIASQAANVQWKSGGYIKPDGQTDAASGTLTLSVFLLQDDAPGVEGGMTAAQKYAALTLADIWGEYGQNTTKAMTDSADYFKTGSGGSLGVTASKAIDEADKGKTLYTIIVGTYDAGKDGNIDMYAVNKYATEINAGGSVVNPSADLLKYIGGSSTAGDVKWQAIPEPTSGLLLLLGVAGLALRRRRA